MTFSGEVTFAGQPVPAGSVYFTPDVAKHNTGPQGVAEIRAGKYSTEGKGTAGGPVQVRIEGFDGQITPNLPYGRPLFVPFEMEIDLPREATTKNLEVPASEAKQLPKKITPVP